MKKTAGARYSAVRDVETSVTLICLKQQVIRKNIDKKSLVQN